MQLETNNCIIIVWCIFWRLFKWL